MTINESTVFEMMNEMKDFIAMISSFINNK